MNLREIAEELLTEYKELCDQMDLEYEFIYVEDVLNNGGTQLEGVNTMLRETTNLKETLIQQNDGRKIC